MLQLVCVDSLQIIVALDASEQNLTEFKYSCTICFKLLIELGPFPIKTEVLSPKYDLLRIGSQHQWRCFDGRLWVLNYS